MLQFGISNLNKEKSLKIHFRFYLNLLFLLTPIRIWNYILLFFSFHISKTLKKNLHLGSPFAISIEPTTSCNLRCPECPSGLRSFTRPTGMMEKDLFENIIMQIHKKLAFLTFYFQGEPYLNPNFLEMVKFAKSKNIFVSTSTNAHYLTEVEALKTVESGLDKLIISIDGSDQDSYQKYRIGGNLNKVITGTKNILEARNKSNQHKPFIEWQFIVFAHNEHQIPEIQKMAREIGVDALELKSAQLYDAQTKKEQITNIEKYARYQIGKNGEVKIKNDFLNHCWRMWQSCVITWDGSLVPCCFDKDASHVLGKIEGKNSFYAIWKSASYQQFRSNILQSRAKIEICKNCTEGLKKK